MGQHRGLVMSKKGMVCSAHPLSSWVGLMCLQRRKSTDAAIAMALATGCYCRICAVSAGMHLCSIMMQKLKSNSNKWKWQCPHKGDQRILHIKGL